MNRASWVMDKGCVCLCMCACAGLCWLEMSRGETWEASCLCRSAKQKEPSPHTPTFYISQLCISLDDVYPSFTLLYTSAHTTTNVDAHLLKEKNIKAGMVLVFKCTFIDAISNTLLSNVSVWQHCNRDTPTYSHLYLNHVSSHFLFPLGGYGWKEHCSVCQIL